MVTEWRTNVNDWHFGKNQQPIYVTAKRKMARLTTVMAVRVSLRCQSGPFEWGADRGKSVETFSTIGSSLSFFPSVVSLFVGAGSFAARSHFP